ncbi:DUF4159 domain-containing protein [Candidatus Poribacteria bacterium]|nr:DUF4159 domain-containing protein [Candidatus Poribacteria bacterium]
MKGIIICMVGLSIAFMGPSSSFGETDESGPSLPPGKLGGVLIGRGLNADGFIRLVRLKHRMADWWQDPTALTGLIEWLQTRTRIRADMRIGDGSLELTDPRILDAPLIIMTGHDEGVVFQHNLERDGRNGPPFRLVTSLTPQERRMLRKYLVERKGTLFFDDCGFKGLFAGRVREELRLTLPEYQIEPIRRTDRIFKIYYKLPGPPTGGDVFWGSENIKAQSLFPYIRGIKIKGRWAVIYNRKDYMCCMETVEVPSRTLLARRRSNDVYRFMTNVIFYVLRYGGNVDRSRYKSR